MKHLGLVILILSLTACSSLRKKESVRPEIPTEPATAASTPTTPETTAAEPVVSLRPSSEASSSGIEIDETKPNTDGIASPMANGIQPEFVDVTQPSHIDQQHQKTSPSQSEATSAPESKNTVNAETALKWLKNGNKRFIRPALRADGQSQKDVKRLIKSEAPHAVVFSTSDSRVPPEIIFDEKLGEIYVIRNLGISVDPSVLNSIDYAVGTLGVKLVLVMDRSYPDKEIDFSHADQTAQKLVDQSQVLKTGLGNNEVKVISAVYNIETGKVHFGK